MHNTVSKLTVKGCVMPLGKELVALHCLRGPHFSQQDPYTGKSSPVQLSYQRWFTEIQGIQALIDQYPSFKKPAGVIKSKKKMKLNKSQGFFAVGKPRQSVLCQSHSGCSTCGNRLLSGGLPACA